MTASLIWCLGWQTQWHVWCVATNLFSTFIAFALWSTPLINKKLSFLLNFITFFIKISTFCIMCIKLLHNDYGIFNKTCIRCFRILLILLIYYILSLCLMIHTPYDWFLLISIEFVKNLSFLLKSRHFCQFAIQSNSGSKLKSQTCHYHIH